MPECQAAHNCEHLSPVHRSRVPLQLSRTLDPQRSLCFSLLMTQVTFQSLFSFLVGGEIGMQEKHIHRQRNLASQATMPTVYVCVCVYIQACWHACVYKILYQRVKYLSMYHFYVHVCRSVNVCVILLYTAVQFWHVWLCQFALHQWRSLWRTCKSCHLQCYRSPEWGGRLRT